MSTHVSDTRKESPGESGRATVPGAIGALVDSWSELQPVMRKAIKLIVSSLPD